MIFSAESVSMAKSSLLHNLRKINKKTGHKSTKKYFQLSNNYNKSNSIKITQDLISDLNYIHEISKEFRIIQKLII